MTGTIATLLAAPKTINIVDADNKGPQRHVYEELVGIQSANDPVFASPYAEADNVNTIPAHTAASASGNFTITLNYPKSGVSVTTGNLIYNASAATIQTAIDTAMSGQVVTTTYTADDAKVVMTGNLNDTLNSCVITSNGAGVTTAYCEVTTANVDLDADYLATPVVTTVGTEDRASEALLAQLGVVTPAGAIIGWGATPVVGDYVTGDNPLSMSPGTKDAVLREMAASEDLVLANFLRDLVGCVS
jgi:hypothetical protein